MFEDKSDWRFLPDLLLEEIFSYLSWRDRLRAACTCRSWNETFYNPVLWKTFNYQPPRYLEKYSQRLYYDIATYNLSNCFRAVGYCFQTVTISPISDFFILNRALKVIGDFYRSKLEMSSIGEDDDPVLDFRSKLEQFSFEFASQVENGVTYGTGGTLLVSIKRLLDVLSGLKIARVKGLLLDETERHGVLNAFIEHNKDSLYRLSLVDLGKTPLCEYSIVNLRNLTFLELGVCEIDDNLLIHLVQETQLEVLVLTQTRFTLFSVEFSTVSAISNHAWDLAIEISPDLRLHQRYLFTSIPDFIDLSNVSVIYQPHPAPVFRFVFSSNGSSLLDLHKLDFYHSTITDLIVIIDSGSPESSSRSSIDDDLLQVAYSCPHLETLVLGGDRISVHSETILQLLLDGSRKLKYLFIEDRIVQYSINSMSTDLFNSYVSNDLIAISSDPQLFLSKVKSQLQSLTWNLLSNRQFSALVDMKQYIL